MKSSGCQGCNVDNIPFGTRRWDTTRHNRGALIVRYYDGVGNPRIVLTQIRLKVGDRHLPLF